MFHRTVFTGVALLLAAIFSTVTHAAGDAERGEILANTCMGCHGIAGYRNTYPSYRVPKLGGQHEDYIVIGLQGYQAETRAHPTMRAQAADLSDQDMRDLAAYFASQGEAKEGKARDDARIARGKEKTSTCVACHGESGISIAANWPSLAGQHRDYLVQALTQYQNGERTDPVMAGQVMNLSAADIADLAAYYAAQPGLFTVSY